MTFLPKLIPRQALALLCITSVCWGFHLSPKPQDIPDQIRIGSLTLHLKSSLKRHVKYHLDILLRNRSAISENLDQIQLYLAIVEKNLIAKGLPAELKYLVLQESNLITQAVHPQLVGFWNLKEDMLRELELEVNEKVDERLNLFTTTEAVAQYLRRSNDYFDNWVLSMLTLHLGFEDTRAYTWKNKIHRSDYKGATMMIVDEKIHSYIHKFLAHKIFFDALLGERIDLDFQVIDYRQGAKCSLKQLARRFRKSGVSASALAKHNAWLKTNKIPTNKVYPVLIPIYAQSNPASIQRKLDFLQASEITSYASPIEDNIAVNVANNTAVNQDNLTKIWLSQIQEDEQKAEEDVQTAMIETAPQNIQAQKHFVQKGQTLYKIALLYGVKIADLRLWNKMQPENDKIYEGQTLIVGTPTQRGAAPQDNKYAYRILQSSNRTAIPTFYQKTQKAQMLVKLQETKIRRNLTENKNTNKCVKRTDRPKEPKK